MKSLERRLSKMENRHGFPDYRPMTDEQIIHSLMGHALRAGLYNGELPPEPPDIRSSAEKLRDEQRNKRISTRFDEILKDLPPCEESEEELALRFFTLHEHLMLMSTSKELKERWELWKNINNIDI